MRIVVDDRERRSGIIDFLRDAGAEVIVKRLLYGDYLIDGQLVVERKTARDFALSVMSGRVFRQIRELKKLHLRVVLLIEGDPYRTAIAIKPFAIRGAILSISGIWQLPVIFSESAQDSVAIFRILSGQLANARITVPQRTILRPKKLINRQLYIIQGLPGVGAKLSHGMLSHFKTVFGVFSAAPEVLVEVDGLGAQKARQIREVLDTAYEE